MSFESNLASLKQFFLIWSQLKYQFFDWKQVTYENYRNTVKSISTHENLDLYIQWLIMFHSLSCFNILINSDELFLANES